MNRSLALTSAVVATLSAAAAQAQDSTAYDIQHFRPVASQSVNYFSLHGSRIQPSHELGLALHYAHRPLVLRDADGERVADLVRNQLTANLLFAFGFGERFELSVNLPIVLAQGADTLDPIDGVDTAAIDGSSAGFGLGDATILTKLRLFGPDADSSGLGLALAVDWYLPTGGSANYQGESFRANPMLALDYAFGGRSSFGVNLGAMFRSETEVLNLTVDDTLTYGVAAAIGLGAEQNIVLTPELRGEAVLGATDFAGEEAPLELIIGAKAFTQSDLVIGYGLGKALGSGFGVPAWRLFLNIGWAHRADEDRDGDGIADAADACPDEPEDVDGFQDANGCPDPDNDGDGVLDADDTCPDQPEDRDGFQDADGCPDPDNDGDGLPDSGDRCPNEPEDRDGDRDEDGCPDGDRDGDGLADDVDMCPLEPEDRDGFEDTDGCPDYDHDHDGILPPTDQCPDQPEDFDGDRDEDGCPEGTVIRCDEITFEGQVLFETNRDTVRAVSFALLNEVAALMIAHPEIHVVEVEGHTDDRGSDATNLDLSNRRAASVRQFLVNAGVDAARLTSRGYGETMPIESNETEEGRQANRRVVFRITDRDPDPSCR
ncbi:MAG: OmpA family protein [Myxococcales bacterium]|nr:OmpA family protein [Myxococcales bacterium]MCB9519957.1 OmpA family protein [Myxococcales bacterium]MCB9532501.1 OmpA family protein [Myxococcales bacterium]MCB9533135.1 OmpA family protein [Myxococcales bacterium]